MLGMMAAAILHAAVLWLEHIGAHFPGLQPAGRSWLGHLAVVLAIPLAWSLGSAAALAVSLVVVLSVLPPPLAAAFAVFTLATWAVARLPAPTWLRIMLVIALNAVMPALRGGLAGESVATALALPKVPAILGLWSALVFRSLLYQLEARRLPAAGRSLLGYAGSLGIVGFAGGGHAVPILFAQLFGRWRRPTAAQLRDGAGLLALGVTYVAVGYLIVRLGLVSVSPGTLGRAVHAGHLESYLVEIGRWHTLVSLISRLPLDYLDIAGNLFIAIGNLRLLGFELGSGFRRPFLSRSLGDFWQRWSYYFRDAALRLFYNPALDVLRRRLPLSLAHGLSVALAFAGLILLRSVAVPISVSNTPLSPFSDSSHAVVVGTAVIGSLTSIEAYLAMRRRRRGSRSPAWLYRGAPIVGTVLLVGLVWTVCFALMRSLRPAEIIPLAGQIFGVWR
jgi:hypothetical protein